MVVLAGRDSHLVPNVPTVEVWAWSRPVRHIAETEPGACEPDETDEHHAGKKTNDRYVLKLGRLAWIHRIKSA